MLRKLAKDLHVRDVLENSSHFDISYETIERDINQGIGKEYLIDHSFGCNKVELKNCVLNRRMFCLLFKFIFRKLNISLDLSDYDITSSMLTFRRMMNSYGKEITNGFLLEHFHVVASIGKHKFTISFNFLIYQKFIQRLFVFKFTHIVKLFNEAEFIKHLPISQFFHLLQIVFCLLQFFFAIGIVYLGFLICCGPRCRMKSSWIWLQSDN